MRKRNGNGVAERVLLTLLTLYALVLIVPDLGRLMYPVGSFGLAANADGRIYDVQGPFASETQSPAWRAGIRPGDHLDLTRMRCVPLDTEICATTLVLWGGMNFVVPGPQGTLVLAAADERPARQVTLVAEL